MIVSMVFCRLTKFLTSCGLSTVGLRCSWSSDWKWSVRHRRTYADHRSSAPGSVLGCPPWWTMNCFYVLFTTRGKYCGRSPKMIFSSWIIIITFIIEIIKSCEISFNATSVPVWKKRGPLAQGIRRYEDWLQYCDHHCTQFKISQ